MQQKKICINCKKQKNLGEFYKQPSAKNAINPRTDGHRNDCKLCHNKKTKARALRHRDSVLEYQHDYYRNYTKKGLKKMAI